MKVWWCVDDDGRALGGFTVGPSQCNFAGYPNHRQGCGWMELHPPGSRVVAGLWLALDIGCIECGEETTPLGLFATQEEAQPVLDAASAKQQADWHGQHYFGVFNLDALAQASED